MTGDATWTRGGRGRPWGCFEKLGKMCMRNGGVVCMEHAGQPPVEEIAATAELLCVLTLIHSRLTLLPSIWFQISTFKKGEGSLRIRSCCPSLPHICCSCLSPRGGAIPHSCKDPDSPIKGRRGLLHTEACQFCCLKLEEVMKDKQRGRKGESRV